MIPLLLLLLACTCRDEAAIEQVVLISIDTLRADFLGCYGNQVVETPYIDWIAAEGVLFENHFVTAPTTLASHAALMTSTYPHTHGAPRNGFILNEANLTLAEVFSQNNWNTAAFVGGFPLKSHFGFGQGFSTFDEEMAERTPGIIDKFTQRDAATVTDATLAWLEKNAEKQLFLFVHYYDVHSPYQAPVPYSTMYFERSAFIQGTADDIKMVQRGIKEGKPGGFRGSEVLKACYAGEVSWTDLQIGRLIEGMAKLGIGEQALIIVTSDHGETMAEFPDKEVWAHGVGVFDTTVHVPLIFRLPGGPAGVRRNALASQIDVMPTILELVGLPLPPQAEGQSMVPLIREDIPFRTEIFAEATKPYNTMAGYEEGVTWTNEKKARAIRTDSHKLIHTPHLHEDLLFSLPDEQTNLLQAPGSRELAKSLKDQLFEWDATANPLPSDFDGGKSTAKMLEALGYIDEVREKKRKGTKQD